MPDLPYQFTLVGLLLGAPLLLFLALMADGKRVQHYAGPVATLVTAGGLILSTWAAFSIDSYALHFPWAATGAYTLVLGFRLDSLTALMLPLVHLIALLVQLYSMAYMRGDKAIHRYYAFLQLFIFSMLGIVLAGDLIVMYIFWELVGLSSYLLIGFWHEKPRTVWAAQKAFILNRIGDAAFLSGILLLLYFTGTTDFDTLPAAIGQLSTAQLTGIGILLFGGCMGKSAQFPLSAWLPDAMEGPTPVSALIHAATMVAAGIFLLARIAFLLTPTAELFIAVIGTITMADGAIRACTAWDIKKVLAYSTQSQLGLMVVSVGMGTWQIALFHLITHAFFKAGLFLASGAVIHAMTPTDPSVSFDPQHMRTMGGLRKQLPITFICYAVCAAALSGLPFFSGFLSKDAIFTHVFHRGPDLGWIAYAALTIALLSASLTAFYMARQLWLVFGATGRYPAESTVHPHEPPMAMRVPIVLLTALSVFICFSWHPIDASNGWVLNQLRHSGTTHSVLVPVLSVLATTAGIFWAWRRIASGDRFLPALTEQVRPSRSRLLKNYSESGHFHEFFLVPFQQIGNSFKILETNVVDGMINAVARLSVVLAHLTGWLDRFLVDGLVKGASFAAHLAGTLVRTVQNGKIQSYFIVTFVSLILLFIWMFVGY